MLVLLPLVFILTGNWSEFLSFEKKVVATVYITNIALSQTTFLAVADCLLEGT